MLNTTLHGRVFCWRGWINACVVVKEDFIVMNGGEGGGAKTLCIYIPYIPYVESTSVPPVLMQPAGSRAVVVHDCMTVTYLSIAI